MENRKEKDCNGEILHSFYQKYHEIWSGFRKRDTKNLTKNVTKRLEWRNFTQFLPKQS